MDRVLIKPIISEKSMQQAANNRYTFSVNKKASKANIYKAIFETFNFKPVSINTLAIKGKTKVDRKTRELSKTESWKKAVVQLTAGQKIDLFDVTEGGHQHHA